MLISVSGVGPKAALSILSATTPEQLAVSIITENEKTLTAVPGIGKRIAQRVILELKDKVAKENKAIKLNAAAGMGTATSMSKLDDVSAALAVLGFSQQEITTFLRTIDIDAFTIEEIIKEALKQSLK